ncbi:16452_t:CDS:2 [Entrophospora sp. SA101]|nr:232_t:CDS:2 [Entrophospora sp. SA101]CAJ0927055.1 16452_t:CDS:2 [Entrophospora sp. SA101]
MTDSHHNLQGEAKNPEDVTNKEKKEVPTITKPKRKCLECGNPNIKYKFCMICEKQYFIRNFSQWTSNNVEIDKFIKYTQTNAVAQVEFFEWIKWNEFDLIEYENSGLYSTVYSAYWIDGPILLWEKTMDCYIRNGPIKVAIKRFNNSQNISREFIDQLAQKIIDGKRPKISKEAPKSYNDLMQQCWDHDPSKRPTASKLYETIGSWFTKICNDPTPTEISIEFDKAEGIKFSKLEKYAFQRQKIHNEAIYTSRLLNFPGLRRQQS